MSIRTILVFCGLLMVVFVCVCLPFFLQGSVHNSSSSPPLSHNVSLHPVDGGRGGVSSQPADTARSVPQSGTPAGCVSATTPGTAMQVIWPSLAKELTAAYISNTYTILCLDKFSSAFPSLTCTQTMKDIILALGWPADLLKSDYETYTECVGPLTPAQIQALATGNASPMNTQQTANIATSCVWDLGDWVVVHPIIQICDFVNQLVKGVLAKPLQATYQQVSSQTGAFLWKTPANLTYNNPTLFHFWTISMGIVTILLAIGLSWVALRSMVRTTNWLSYANVVEFLPRILFGVIGAYATIAVAHLIIDFSNALSAIFTSDLTDKIASAQPDNPMAVLLQAIYIILALLLVLEEAARFVVIYALIGFGPIWAFCASFRETQGIAKSCLQGLFVFALLQPVQNALLDMGEQVMSSMSSGSVNTNILQLLIAVGILALVLSLLFVAARTTLGGIASPLSVLALGATGVVAARGASRLHSLPSFVRKVPLRGAASLAVIAAPHIGRAASTIARFSYDTFDAFRPLHTHGPKKLKRLPGRPPFVNPNQSYQTPPFVNPNQSYQTPPFVNPNQSYQTPPFVNPNQSYQTPLSAKHRQSYRRTPTQDALERRRKSQGKGK